MGNHEFNAICYATPDPHLPGEYIRKHTAGNPRTHQAVEHCTEAPRQGSALYEAVEILLNGPEIPVPQPYLDHGGKARNKARVRWWDADARTLKDLADVRGMKAADGGDYPPLPPDEVDSEHLSFVYADSVPVIYGTWFRRCRLHSGDVPPEPVGNLVEWAP